MSSHCVWDALTVRGAIKLSPAQQLVMRCTRCGERYVAVLPSTCGMVSVICRQFQEDHERCPPRPSPGAFDVTSPCHNPVPVGPTDPVPLRDALLEDSRVMGVDQHVAGRFIAMAMRGAGMREHVDAHHPGQDAEALAVLFAEERDREAWLAGYRFEAAWE